MKQCNQCGKCCTKYGATDLDVSEQEIEMWHLFNPEIAQYIKGDRVWFDPDSGEPLQVCPFLQIDASSTTEQTKYTCSIYLHRPDDCRQYPSTIPEMIRDECEMIEVTDITHQKQAQEKLNKIRISEGLQIS